MRFFILLFVVSFLFSFSKGVDPYLELEKVAERWQNPNNYLQCQIEMLYFDDLRSNTPVDSLGFTMMKKGEKSLVQSDEFEFLELGRESVYVDVLSRKIHIFDYPDDIQTPNLDVASFIDMAKKFEGFEARQKANIDGTASIIFEAPNHSKTKIELVYSPKNYLVQKTEISVSVEDEPEYRVVVNYSDYVVSKKVFPYRIESFVKWDGRKFIPVYPRHSGFDVIKHKKN